MSPALAIERLLVAAALCALVLAVAEAWRRLGGAEPEWTRKLVHVGMGLVAATFPWLLPNPWSVALLCGSFAVLMTWSRAAGVFLSVDGIARRSFGGTCYPIGVLAVFLIGHDQPAVYVASVLVLAVSDPLAALVGRAHGRHRYHAGPDSKSLEGSAAFFASAFCCVYVPLRAATPPGVPETLLAALSVATLATGLEATAPCGTDNLLVPVGTCLALGSLTTWPASAPPIGWLAVAVAGALAGLASGAPREPRSRLAAASGRS